MEKLIVLVQRVVGAGVVVEDYPDLIEAVIIWGKLKIATLLSLGNQFLTSARSEDTLVVYRKS